MFTKIIMFLFSAKTALVNCNFESRTLNLNKERIKIEKTGKLDKSIPESSGITRSPWSDNLLTINDSGNSPEVFEVNQSGDLISKFTLPDSKNRDWEEISTDKNGNIYVGDIGNNKSLRKNLTVYKYDGEATREINFSFADQNFDEPQNKEYDCEALFWNNDSLYIFTKSWKPGIKTLRLYAVPDQPGDYAVKSSEQILIKAQVTGAAINPSGTQFALISYGKIFLFGIENGMINFTHPQFCIKIARNQSEAIMYEDDNTLIFTNEQRGIYKIDLKKILNSMPLAG